MDALPERVGRYEILSLIGRGAMGVVYLARDPLIAREVALKRVSFSDLLPEDQRAEFKERFFREARAAGNLRHPNVVTVYDVGEADGVPYMAMEHLSGGSLSALMKSGALPLGRAVEIVRQVALGLHYAHGRGIIHRDVKPDNILLDAEGRPVVTDFGAAHIQSSELTRTGEVLGTPHYMSPEQILGEELDGRSDLFSLGVVFYLMVTGRRPFKGDTISAICYHIVHSPPEPVPEGMGIPPDALPILQKLLAKQRDERFPDGSAVAGALEGLSRETAGGHPAGSMTQTVSVSTPTPRPRTIPASAPPPLPAPMPPPQVPRPPAPAHPQPPPKATAPPPEEKAGPNWFLWILVGLAFLAAVVVALLAGAWMARRAEVAAPQVAPAPGSLPGTALPSGAASAPKAPSSPAPQPATAAQNGSQPQASGASPRPAPPPPKTRAPTRPVPPAPQVPAAPAGPDAAVMGACQALARDADRAVALAHAKDFSGAFALADRFPQRFQEIARAAGPLEDKEFSAAREKAQEASRSALADLEAWARPVMAQAEAAYNQATRGRDNKEGIILSYRTAAPVIAWKDRLPAELKEKVEEFAEDVEDDLDDDEWSRAKGGGSR